MMTMTKQEATAITHRAIQSNIKAIEGITELLEIQHMLVANNFTTLGPFAELVNDTVLIQTMVASMQKLNSILQGLPNDKS
jgi:hypothetical protein